MSYVLRGLDRVGNVYYYTGKAGMGWLSYYPYEAFEFGKGAAQIKATNFNRMEPVHGYWFVVQQLQEVK
jgi:hypothetical protein